MPLNEPAVKDLLSLAVEDGSLLGDGQYTRPRSWGVYEIEPPAHGRATRRYRIGNHPLRQRELEAEFGGTKRVALFTSRTLAERLERLLNKRA